MRQRSQSSWVSKRHLLFLRIWDVSSSALALLAASSQAHCGGYALLCLAHSLQAFAYDSKRSQQSQERTDPRHCCLQRPGLLGLLLQNRQVQPGKEG